MRISDIQRCEVRPGRLVEWGFSPATVAAATVLATDPRPPADLHEEHIRTARGVREGGVFVPTWACAAAMGDHSPRPRPVEVILCRRCYRRGMSYVESRIIERAKAKPLTETTP